MKRKEIEKLTAAKVFKIMESSGNAELTGRLIPGDDDFEYPEWAEDGKIGDVEVRLYYRTTPEDLIRVEDHSGDWGEVDWADRVDRFEIID